jgi:hypothetical protein
MDDTKLTEKTVRQWIKRSDSAEQHWVREGLADLWRHGQVKLIPADGDNWIAELTELGRAARGDLDAWSQ